MDGTPLLVEIGRHMRDLALEAVLIGNAAAALQGAPVTTVDFDFLFPKTQRNMEKLKALAEALGAVVLRPYYLSGFRTLSGRPRRRWPADRFHDGHPRRAIV